MAIVKKYKSIVKEITSPTEGIFVVTFSSDKDYKFKAGQFLHLALDEYNPSLQWPDSRCFSIQSSPQVKDIKITFSVKGNFTRKMAEELVPGKEVTLKLPYGSLFANVDNLKKYVFIAGGTGVTPFLSMFTDASFANFKSPKLYLGLRQPSYNIYQEELKISREINKTFLVNLIYQESDGILNIEKILKENGVDSNYYISGPPAMITAFKSYLLESKVKEINIFTDDWE